MNESLTFVTAFVLGLLASGHCVLMCGGISGALMLAADGPRRPSLRLLLAMQFGRVTSYMLAALALAGTGAWLVHFLDQDGVRFALRAISAVVLAGIGMALLGRARGLDIGMGRLIWPRLAPLARGLLPVRHLPQAFALGAIWGWMPCGFVYSVLLLAWLSMDPLRSAAIMLLFGLGTMPALLAATYGLGGALRWAGRQSVRSMTAVALLWLAGLTLAGPWLLAHAGSHVAHWLPLECLSR
jgi:sulfite exporter TauE/SafE